MIDFTDYKDPDVPVEIIVGSVSVIILLLLVAAFIIKQKFFKSIKYNYGDGFNPLEGKPTNVPFTKKSNLLTQF